MHGGNENVATTRLSSLVMLVVLGMLACILFPSIQRSRYLARGESCSNNLKRIGLATHNYHSAYKQLPVGCGGTDGQGRPERGNDYRLSGFVGLLPFLEQQTLWEKISNPTRIGNVTIPPMGPVPSFDPSRYRYWGVQVPYYLCPSEPVEPGEYGLRNYVHCYGDGVEHVGNAEGQELRIVCRGMFARKQHFKFRDTLDGMANTVMVSETVIGIGDTLVGGGVARDIPGIAESPSVALGLIDPDDRKAYRESVNLWEAGKGSRWADGSFRVSGFTTVLPPNSPSCTAPDEEWSGIMSASSHHIDGVPVLMGDGAVRFVSNSIDTGDLSQPSVAQRFGNAGSESPYGAWGALGTRASRELIPRGALGSFAESPPEHGKAASLTAEDLIDRLDQIQASLDQILKRLEKLEQSESNR